MHHSLRCTSALMTDWYQLTMAQAYWRKGLHDTESVFHLFFRNLPFKGNFAIVAGLEYVIDLIPNFRFSSEDIEFLASKTSVAGSPIFDPEFLTYLSTLRFSITLDAIPEGTVVFGHEPLLRVTGPLLQCQLLETILLNIVNFQTLIATKAARLRLAAQKDKVAEFGLRRCQGLGGVEATRAAMIGGCDATSNVLAAKEYDLPVMGTQAHSWIMSFASELEAFETWCSVSPDSQTCLLVDTYNVEQGLRNAITVGKKLQKDGRFFQGIRLDSGNLLELSIKARQMLNQAGLPLATVVASGDLDEYQIAKLKQEGAKIDVWGVGTNLVTAEDQPALGGVYKLGAIKSKDKWEYRMKFSENPEKTTDPGILDVMRFSDEHGTYVADVIYDCDSFSGLTSSDTEMKFTVCSATEHRKMASGKSCQFLLKPYLANGERVLNSPLPCITDLARFAKKEIEHLPKEYQSLTGCTVPYSVSLTQDLARLKYEMFQGNKSTS